MSSLLDTNIITVFVFIVDRKTQLIIIIQNGPTCLCRIRSCPRAESLRRRLCISSSFHVTAAAPLAYIGIERIGNRYTSHIILDTIVRLEGTHIYIIIIYTITL